MSPNPAYSVGDSLDAPTAHIVSRRQFEEAVSFLGGFAVDDQYGALSLSWSLRAAEKLKTPARESWLTYEYVPPEYVEKIWDAYIAISEKFERDREQTAAKINRRPCRQCRSNGVTPPRAATKTMPNDGWGKKVLCADCYKTAFSPMELVVYIAPKAPIPMDGVFCRHCACQIMRTPNIDEQIKLIGRFARLCPACWVNPHVDHEEVMGLI